jgi:HTH-type transcriptional regulator/antitoxin HigA
MRETEQKGESQMTERKTLEAFAPGEYILDELSERGWNQEDLAAILGRSTKGISELITGKTGITQETALELSSAFGVDPEFWLNLEARFRLSTAGQHDNALTRRRALIYSKAPIRTMIKRGWIEVRDPRNVEELERRLCEFFGIPDMTVEPQIAASLRMSASYESYTPAQVTWLVRARQLSLGLPPLAYTRSKLENGIQRLRSLALNVNDAGQVPHVLEEMGIRLVILEPLPQTKIDGASFWLGGKSPVVALSMRYDRIDWFWFTLMHEVLGHVGQSGAHKDYDVSMDLDLLGEQPRSDDARPQVEREADLLAADFLIPRAGLDSFIRRVGPFYSKRRIEGFAILMKVHPGIVVGQLQRRGEIAYSASRDVLVKIRDVVIPSALTDGWGHVPSIS